MKTTAIITAGGNSSRFGNTNKLLEKINAKPVLSYCTEAFLASDVDEVIICANHSIIKEVKALFPQLKIIEGGETRQESVYKGLCEADDGWVVIHDGARPLITPMLINKVIEKVKEKQAVTVVCKTVDTIKKVHGDKVTETIDRALLYNTQTPQAFETSLIKSAHEKFKGQNFTDDAGMVEALNKDVFILENTSPNFKITTPMDLEILRAILA